MPKSAKKFFFQIIGGMAPFWPGGGCANNTHTFLPLITKTEGDRSNSKPL